ncbi:uncharacterized protein YndB with AHSA1/START domain [Kribbella amoyensis]|uniref:Uncharacterized protein YndB with AHSA1/START domain n=1 Tax=Kribbella amoyensis TaxID=996641 RepID=A0A561BUW8_9ACTN|nr:SRPBCC family protein [Kribbella amoyensis]TWD82686.1 uncharacterized protein YndB with AHSA1/START domain [Kribbella amoyensis]
MKDILEHLSTIQREARWNADTVTASVLLRRTYQAEIEDVWDALTDPDRIKRWFSPVTGELKAGGTFQIQDNAGGDIVECEAPKRFKVTFGGPTSLVEVRLTPGPGETTEFELEHAMTEPPAPGTGGALYVGPGWDGAVVSLGLYLAGEIGEDSDPVEMANSPEVIKLNEKSVYTWIEVVRASGDVTEEELRATAEISLAQFAPDSKLDLS